MLRSTYEKKLRELMIMIVDMGKTVEDQLNDALYALRTRDIKKSSETIFNDIVVNQKEREIERMSLSLILTQQPVASDLRFISCCLKLITDLERIGDNAQDIAELSIAIGDKELHHMMGGIDEIFAHTKEMLKLAIDAYVETDIELAHRVREMDDTVDALYDEFKRNAIQSIRNTDMDPEVVIDMIQVAKYLERVSDHAENIAEWVIFAISGEHVDSLINPKREGERY